jgi:Skp family chaperone for outer membrane proteins
VAQRAQKKIEQEFSKRDRELATMAEQLKKTQESLERNAMTMSESDRQRSEREFNDLNREFQRKQRQFREDLTQRRNEELGAVIERANRAVKLIAEAEKLDVVFQNEHVVWASPPSISRTRSSRRSKTPRGSSRSVTQSSPRTYLLGEIVTRLGGELVGDAAAEIRRIATLESAGPGDLSFLANPRYRRSLEHTRASAVILARNERNATSLPRILCDDPYVYYAHAAQLLYTEDRPAPGVHSRAVVEPDSEIAASAAVGPIYVGRRVRLGEECHRAGCVIGGDVQIGDGFMLQSPSIRLHLSQRDHSPAS